MIKGQRHRKARGKGTEKQGVKAQKSKGQRHRGTKLK